MIASIKEFIFKYLNILERMLEQKFLFSAPHVEMSSPVMRNISGLIKKENFSGRANLLGSYNLKYDRIPSNSLVS